MKKFIVGLCALAMGVSFSLAGPLDYPGAGSGQWKKSSTGIIFSATQNTANSPIVEIYNKGTGNASELRIKADANNDATITLNNGTFDRIHLKYDTSAAKFQIINNSAGGNPFVEYLGGDGSTRYYNPNSGTLMALQAQAGGHWLYNFTTEPGVSANGTVLYSTDVASSWELFVKDEAANITQLSPHNAAGDYVFFSYNRTSKAIEYVNMTKMIDSLELLSGLKFRETLKKDLPLEYQDFINKMDKHLPIAPGLGTTP